MSWTDKNRKAVLAAGGKLASAAAAITGNDINFKGGPCTIYGLSERLILLDLALQNYNDVVFKAEEEDA